MERWNLILCIVLHLCILIYGHKSRRNQGFRCRQVGLYSHPTNCGKFYRCVIKEGRRHHYALFTLSCPPNLAYNERTKSCSVFPVSSQCLSLIKNSNSSKYIRHHSQSISKFNCKKEGIFRHPDDCRKFYRCADYDGDRKSLTAFEYSCPKNLLFNEKLGTCDWPDFTPSCDTSSLNKEHIRTHTKKKDTKLSQTTKANDDKQKYSSFKCVREGFFRDPDNCRKFYRCVNYSKSGKRFRAYEFKCPKKLVFDHRLNTCNWPNKEISCEGDFDMDDEDETPTDEVLKVTKKPSLPKPTSIPKGNETNLCRKEGFYRHPKNCSTFFRCIKQDKEYRSYYFSCPNNLVFDERISGCNWPDKSPPCFDNFVEISKPPKHVSINPNLFHDQRRAERYPRSLSLRESPPKFPYLSSVYYENRGRSMKGIFVSKHSSDSELKCEKEGIFKHPKYCHEFYVCSDFDNTKTDYKIFEFVCPNDMVYDEELDDCVEPPPDSPCAHNKEEKCKHNGTSTDSVTESTSNDGQDSTTDSSDEKDGKTEPSDDKEKETEPSNDKDDSKTESPDDNEGTSSEKPPEDGDNSSKENESAPIKCKKSGFFRHPDDCNRFYRCVDYNNDSKSFVVYEFKCGEGLVFDEANSVCNWPSSVPECSSGGGTDSSKDDSDKKDDGESDGTTDKEGTTDESSTPENEENGDSGTEGTTDSDYDCDTEGQSTTESSDKVTDSSEGDDSTKEGKDSDEGTDNVDDSKDAKDSDETTKSDTSTESAGEGHSEDSGSTPKMDESTDSNKPDGKDPSTVECKKSGYFRNPSNCSKFYRCVNHDGDGKSFKIYHFECPSGLIFDEVLSVCNWPDQAQPRCKENGTETSDDKSTGSGKDETPDESGTTEPSSVTDDEDTKTDSSNGKDGQTESPEDKDSKDEPTESDKETDSSTSKSDDGDPDCQTTEKTDEDVTSEMDKESSTKATGTDDNDKKMTQETDDGSSQSTEGGIMDEQTTEETNTAITDSNEKESSDKVECTKAGFFRNPNNCSKFYRCVDYEGDGKSFKIFHFDCPNNLVFDEDLHVCTWPDQAQPPCKSKDSEKDDDKSKDSEKGGEDKSDKESGEQSTTSDGMSTEDSVKSTDEGSKGETTTQSDGMGTEKDPTDESTNQETTDDEMGETKKSDESTESSTDSSEITSTSTTTESNEIDDTKTDKSEDSTSSETCTEEGYFRNPKDCSKFYRCVDYEGDGKSFTIFHFDCPENTAFDDILDVCVWPEQARPPCKDDGSSDKGSDKETTDDGGKESTTESSDEGEPTKESTKDSDDTSDEGKESTTESSDKKESTKEGTKDDETTKESGTKESEEETTQRTESSEITESKDDSDSTTESGQGTTDDSGQTDDSSDSSDLCKKAGYFRHPEDCNKFYRCVDYSGNGTSFKIFHFKCPKNTVFDDVSDVCVWPDQAQPPCETDSSDGGDSSTSSDKQDDSTTSETDSTESSPALTEDSTTEESSDSTSSTDKSQTSTPPKKKKPCPGKKKPTSTTEQMEETTSEPEESTSESEGTSESEETTSESEGTTSESEETSQPEEETTSKQKEESGKGSNTCKKAGFFRDSEDCNKFYRCVENDKKSFIIYNFKCPENTYFDEELDVCVWPGQENPPCQNTEVNQEEDNIIPDGHER